MDNCYEQSIGFSLGNEPPDLILKNGIIADVVSGQFKRGDITIKGHRIVGLYDDYTNNIGDNTEILDLDGRYVLPGLIDPHIHIESSMLTLTNFAKIVIPHGTTTIVNDPHEVANVFGKRGIRQFINEGEDSNLRCYFTIPSCVPALGGIFEENGGSLELDDIKSLFSHGKVVGLGEVMNYPGIVNSNPEVLAKLNECHKASGYKKYPLIIDGHCPDLSGKALSAYINAGIMADHECATGKELEEKLSKGMHIMIRNGSSARNMEELLAYVIKKGIDTRRLMFCSDDKNPEDIVFKGHIDNTLREAVALVRKLKGKLSVIELIRMATLNVADFFGFRYLGKLTIQSRADMSIFDDITDFRPYATIINGRIEAMEGKLLNDPGEYPYHSFLLNSVKITKKFKAQDFKIASKTSKKVRVIKINPGQLVTDEKIEIMALSKGEIAADLKRDILKIAIINRHNGKNNYTVGFVNGFGIKRGAVASTVGHDSHNLGVVGTNDVDMAYAVEKIKEMQGGIVIVDNRKTIASIELKFAGLMSIENPEMVTKYHKEIEEGYRKLGGALKSSFITMSFLQLPVIPYLKITDKALVKMGQKGPEIVSLFAD